MKSIVNRRYRLGGYHYLVIDQITVNALIEARVLYFSILS